MGRGHLKRKKEMKLMFLSQARNEIARLQAENKALKEDPNSVIGQFIERFNGVIQQNNRLSALTASLIKLNGDKVTVSKEIMESWKNCRLQIKVETPKGVDSFEEATELIFTYEVMPIEAPGQMPIEKPDVDKTPCIDPECPLNKDGIKHIHATVPVPGPASQAPLSPEQLAGATNAPISGTVHQPEEAPLDTTDGNQPTQQLGEGGTPGEVAPETAAAS